ncbi:MAG: TonB-dependent receptor [Sphingomonas sp.]|uniref:TonB-dependent receptor n=1 Tax=Sphingomonas sp. TaxID=28214 RepID=UPI003F7E5957
METVLSQHRLAGRTNSSGRRGSKFAHLTSASALNLLAIAMIPSVAHAQDVPSSSSAVPAPADTNANTDAADDIVVTATKRSESLRSVSGSVSALTGANLDAIGAQGFKDYLQTLPGVQFQASVPGVSNVTMRGIGTASTYPDQGQATTGIYINDIPVTDPGFALSVPDLDVFDVQRVEVLRGPQGTLYGAATLGGAVNYIYNPVSLTDVQAAGQASLTKSDYSSDLGYTAKLALNVPLVNNVLGVRLAAIRRSDAGFTDNIGTGTKDSNFHRVWAFRGNVLLKLSDNFNLSYFGLYDQAKNGDGFAVFPQFGQYVRDTTVNEPTTFTTQLHNVKLNGDFGFATLVVSLADLRKKQFSQYDASTFDGPGAYGNGTAKNHSQIAEIRLASSGSNKFDWLIGGYYDKTNEYYPSPEFVGNTPLTFFSVNYRSHEKSIFGEATYHFTDQLKLTVGGRYYNIDIATNTAAGVSTPGSPLAAGKQKSSGFSPKASLTYEASKDFMVYALYSRGFRMGGVNLNPSIPSFPTPATYGSDSVNNYEIGTRLSFVDRKVFLDTTAYYVDWSNVQLRLARPDNRSYVANAGSARSYGVESSLTVRPSRNFELQGNVTYLTAELAKTLVQGNGTVLLKGRDLPGAAHWTTSANAKYTFNGPNAPYIMIAHQYISGSTNNFDPTSKAGNYSLFSARAGARFDKFDVQVFVSNIFNKRGITTVDYYGADQVWYVTQPRAIGLSIDWKM